MQVNILWTGREYYSLENCLMTKNHAGSEISSVIIGMYNKEIYRVEYFIKTNEIWETLFFELKIQLYNNKNVFSYKSDGKGNWTLLEKPANEFNGCTDIDIPLTPFTNTLPINRLNLNINESRVIKVIYIDVLNSEIKPVQQKYSRMTEAKYKFENVPNDFEAVITVDESGFVVDYHELFERTIKCESEYKK
ncbi:MAG TPA: putative glycolipid-binding domain-containing protein [Ignavibacteriaceae bacterium]|nr:putative glycolipid-binding domain-containing protein [Ignavibacteriaceae bacterium]